MKDLNVINFLTIFSILREKMITFHDRTQSFFYAKKDMLKNSKGSWKQLRNRGPAKQRAL